MKHRPTRLVVTITAALALTACAPQASAPPGPDEPTAEAAASTPSAAAPATEPTAHSVDEGILNVAEAPPGFDRLSDVERAGAEAMVSAVVGGGPCIAVVMSGVLVPLVEFGFAFQEESPTDDETRAWYLAMATLTEPDLDEAPVEVAAAVRAIAGAFLDLGATLTNEDWFAALEGDDELMARAEAAFDLLDTDIPPESARIVEDWLAASCGPLLAELGFDDLFLTGADATATPQPDTIRADVDAATPWAAVTTAIAAQREGDTATLDAVATERGRQMLAGLGDGSDLDQIGAFACSEGDGMASCAYEVGHALVMTRVGDTWIVDDIATMSGEPPTEYCVEDVTPLNVRPAPGTDNTPIGTYAVDACGVYDLTAPATTSGSWRLVSRRDLHGWVYDPHLCPASRASDTTSAPDDLEEFLAWVADRWVARDFDALTQVAGQAAVEELRRWFPDEVYVRYDFDCLPGSSGGGGCPVAFVEDGAGWSGTMTYVENAPGWILTSYRDVESTS